VAAGRGGCSSNPQSEIEVIYRLISISAAKTSQKKFDRPVRTIEFQIETRNYLAFFPAAFASAFSAAFAAGIIFRAIRIALRFLLFHRLLLNTARPIDRASRDSIRISPHYRSFAHAFAGFIDAIRFLFLLPNGSVDPDLSRFLN
jgi:hypothetical protein